MLRCRSAGSCANRQDPCLCSPHVMPALFRNPVQIVGDYDLLAWMICPRGMRAPSYMI